MTTEEQPLDIGTLVVYWGSIPEYRGREYTVVTRRQDHLAKGEWRYDLEPVDVTETKGLFGARRASLTPVAVDTITVSRSTALVARRAVRLSSELTNMYGVREAPQKIDAAYRELSDALYPEGSEG